MFTHCFVTGTDTEIGKTVITTALLRILRNGGLNVVGMKPVAAGCHDTADGLRNDDALALLAESSGPVDYDAINPYAYAPPIAPHIAANQRNEHISLDRITDAYNSLAERFDAVVVEGVGGWKVPLNDHETVESLAVKLGLPVVLVVGVRLGCINHALLTACAIDNSGVPLIGWVANCVDPDTESADENIRALQARIAAPLLGVVPYMEGDSVDTQRVADCISLDSDPTP